MDFEDAELYRDITDFAHDTPTWVQHTAEIWTEAGLLLFGALFVSHLVARQARHHPGVRDRGTCTSGHGCGVRLQ